LPPWVEPAVTVASGAGRAMLTMILDVLDRRDGDPARHGVYVALGPIDLRCYAESDFMWSLH